MNTGGPAFPVPTPHCSEGVTILDYFAGLAMQAMVSGQESRDFKSNYDKIAHEAYFLAQAMLDEKKRREK